MIPLLVLIPLMVLGLVLLKLNQSLGSPVLSIINRWLRGTVLAGGMAIISIHYGWNERGLSSLFIGFLLIWVLCDGISRWIAIQALSVSSMPLFHRFVVNRAGDEWPVQDYFLRLREKIRAAKFKQVQAIRTELLNGMQLRISIYQTADNITRLQAAFIPQPVGSVTVCLHFTTQLASGLLVVTDNHFLPFAGFYPENWRLERRPNCRNFNRLLKCHLDRVAAFQELPVAWFTEPLEDMNRQQTELEKTNLELGFLLPLDQHEEYGRISYEGRYRIWKEMLSLGYFGRSARYD
jgi:hypothetical protein